ncbi:MAG: hypothetical protein KC461_03215, partial [Dehalococcoidia bacterium]|nr:hypothetical protein [Dehalococcoidia bacterium]
AVAVHVLEEVDRVENMYRDRDSLTRESQEYLRKTDGRYPNGQTQAENPLRTSMPTARSRVDVAGIGGAFGPQRLPGRHTSDKRN